MTTSHTAQGLASLGRHGDTMLVHMSPHEVAGLNYLAKKQGTKLTVNPDTGLPEAFSLGGFFSSLLPTLAGMAFAPATGGFSMAPLLAGAATGAVMAGVQGKDPLMGGLMGGLGGYGGGQLGPALGAATPGGYVAGQVVKGAANPLMDTTVNTALNQAGTSMMTNPLITNAANSMTQAGLGAGSGIGFMDKATQNIMSAGSGLKNIATGQPGAYDAFKAAGGTPMQLALPVGGAVLGGLEPSDIYGEPINMDEARKKQAYDPYATLNLGNDTGLRLVAKGGYIDGYAVGGTVTTGGLRDLYGTADNNTNPQLSRDGYGVGRLENLARQQAMTQAQTTGYAMGGPVSFADGGDAMKLQDEISPVDQGMGLTSLMPPATTPPAPGQAMPTGQVQNAAAALSDTASSDSSIIAQVANNLRTDPNYQPKNPIEAAIAKQIKGTDQTQQSQGLGSIAPSQPMAPSFNPSVAMGPTYFAGMNAPQGYADGGEVSNYGQNQAALNLDRLPSLNLRNGSSGQSEGFQRVLTGFGELSERGPSPGHRMVGDFMSGLLSYDPVIIDMIRGGKAPQGYAEGGETSLNLDELPALNVETGKQSYNTIQSALANSDNPQGRLLNKMFSFRPGGRPSIYDQFTAQGLGRLNNSQMAKGGYLDGQGDGMSDSIPATIEGKQPARLADGEFVVPADVVSHLGNGSSKAGSKRLYAMLDKVRHARTGNKKQGKEIKAEKYLPA